MHASCTMHAQSVLETQDVPKQIFWHGCRGPARHLGFVNAVLQKQSMLGLALTFFLLSEERYLPLRPQHALSCRFEHPWPASALNAGSLSISQPFLLNIQLV